ncbi:MAG: discoidin domain-containing protein, partial [Eubacterium sp.]|nr:discoidin domain-containing protein [Eubacterium sp.]
RNYTATANGGAGWAIDTADTGDSYGYMQMIANGVAGATAYTSYNAANDSTSAVAQVKNYFEHRIAGLDETWNVSYEASVSTENNQVIVSWDAMDGATGYRLTFSGKYTAPGAPEQALVQQIADDYTAQTVDVPAGTTSYNLTTNGYEVEDGTDITVAYSTDSGNTYTTLATTQFNAPAPVAAADVNSVVGGGTAVASDTKTVDETTLYNYSRYEEASATGSTEDIAASNAIDKNGGSRWASSASDPQYIIIDLKHLYEVKQFVLWWETASAKDFTVELSTDGTNYTTVATIENASAGANRLDTITLSSGVDARYIKINGTTRTTGYGYSLWDVGIYGPDEEIEGTPDYSSVTVPDDGWTKIGTDTSGNDWYFGTAQATALGCSGHRELSDTPSSLTYSAGITISTPALGFGMGGAYAPSAKSIWVNDTKLVDESQTFFHSTSATDVMFFAQSLFEVNEITYIGVRAQNGNDYFLPIKVVGEEVTTEETTTPEPTTAAPTVIEPLDAEDIPALAEWTDLGSSSVGTYQYYTTYDVNTYFPTREVNGGNVHFGMGVLGAPFSSVKVCGVEIQKTGDGNVYIPETDLTESGVYKVDIVAANGSDAATIYVKKTKIMNYVPTGIAITQAGVMTWTPSADATTAGATYSVTFNGSTTNNISTGTTTLDLTGVAYGEYNVVLKTYVAGSEVDSQTVSFKYKDPEAVDSTLHSTGTIDNAWEKERCDYMSWDAVEDHTYAIYVDGKLWEDDITETSYNVPAYALVDTENGTSDKNGQAQTIGQHSISVVAIPDGQNAPEAFADVNSKKVIGTDTFTLNKNYIYGDKTDIWNNTGVPSKWNFTITPKDGEVSGLKATYLNDGTVTLTNITSAAQWDAKAAIYDRHLNVEDVGGLVNISFDLTITDGDIINTIRDNPGSLKIGIKCVADEIANDNGNYTYAGKLYGLTQEQIDAGLRWVYQDPRNVTDEEGFDPNLDGPAAEYPFVYDEQTGTAVLHYSFTFTPVLDTYDLLFDLHGLDGATLNLSDAVAKDIYKVTKVVGSPIPNGENISNSSIQVGWNTNVPEHLADNYYYKVYIDDVKVSDNATLDHVYTGYGAGEHAVKVESYYGLPAGQNQEETGVKTGEETATVNIVQEDKANLVISDIKITDNNGNNENGIFYAGDTIKIKVTTKNIGTAPAAPTVDNLTTWLYKKSVSDNAESNVQNGWVILFNKNSGETIPVGGTRDAEYTYTIGAGDVGIVTFRGVADIDKHVDELSEKDNEKIARFKFYEQPKELTLTNDGTDVTATWPAVTGTPDSIKLKYTTSDDQEHEITIPSASTSYTFPADVVLKNNTQVIVETVYGNDVINHAVGTAKADLVATSVGTSGDTANLDVDNNIVFVVKNIGTAQAVTNDLVIWASDGQWTNYKAGISIDLDPNETITDSVPGYHPTTVGTKTLNYKVDERNNVVESNEQNNNDTFEVVVAEIAYPDLVIDSLTIAKDAYKVGDVIQVRMVMKNVGEGTATAAGNIVEKLVINGVNGAWSTEGIHTLAPYDSENPEENIIDYTFNYTVTQEDYVRGYIDIAGRADADNNVPEGTAGETNNLTENTRVKVVDSGTVTLTNTNGVVSASWNAGPKATGYKISYTSNGTVYTEVIDTTGAEPNATLAEGTYTYTFSRQLDQSSTVDITATYDNPITGESAYYAYATAVAKPDFIITNVVASTNDYKVKVPFSLTATVKNIGTAQAMPSPTGDDDVTIDYAYWIGINMPAISPNIAQVIGTHTINGLTVGSTVDLQINDINVLKEGSYDLVIKADDLGYVQQAETGHFDELNENNN